MMKVAVVVLIGRWVDLYVMVFPSTLGETPLFIPTPTEWAIRAYPSPDENLLIVRPTDFDFENGRLCAFDVTEVTERVALGCEDINIDYSVSVFVTQPDL